MILGSYIWGENGLEPYIWGEMWLTDVISIITPLCRTLEVSPEARDWETE